jgi:Leucine Rich repeat
VNISMPRIRAPILLTRPSFLYLLSDDLQIHFLSLWLDVRSLATLDVAVSSHGLRLCWMTLLNLLRSPAVDSWGRGPSSLMWLSRRGIRASRVQIKIDTSRVEGRDILLIETSNVADLGLRGCCNIRDRCVMDIVSRCPKLKSIDLGGCRLVTDSGVSPLGTGCGQLQSINLARWKKVTDAGVSALGAGCGQLQSVDLTCCRLVTDAGVSALGAGCGQLQSINLTCCRLVTGGVLALGAGCGQLQSIDLARCDKVTDASVSALGAGCSQLQSIDLNQRDKVTDAGVSALGAGCSQLQSIDLVMIRRQMLVYQRCLQDVVSC